MLTIGYGLGGYDPGQPDNNIVAVHDEGNPENSWPITRDYAGSGTWTWWAKPRAVRVEGTITQTFVGYTDETGAVIVSAFEDDSDEAVSSFVLQQFATMDDHNTPAIIARAGKPLLCLWANHNNDRLMRFRRTVENADTVPLSEMTWGATQTLDLGNLIDSYTPTFVDANDHLWTFVRRRDEPVSPPDDTYHAWTLVKSTDWGQTYGSPVQVFNGYYAYMAATLCDDDTTLRIALGRHPNEDGDKDAYYCELNLATGDITVPGSPTPLGNLDGTNLPLVFTSLQKASTVTPGYGQWVFDVGPTDPAQPPVIATASFDYADIAGTGNYHILRRDGAWSRADLAPTGAAIWANYLGGIQLEPDGTAWLSRKSGSSWRVERHTTTDHATWTPTLHMRVDAPEAIRSPWPVENGTSRLRAVGSIVRSFTYWDDFDADMVAIPDP